MKKFLKRLSLIAYVTLLTAHLGAIQIYKKETRNWYPVTQQIAEMTPSDRAHTIIITDFDGTLYFDAVGRNPSLQWDLFMYFKNNTWGIIGCTDRGEEHIRETEESLNRDKLHFTNFTLIPDSPLKENHQYKNGCIYSASDLKKSDRILMFLKGLQSKKIPIQTIIFVDDKEDKFAGFDERFSEEGVQSIYLYRFDGDGARSRLIVDQTVFSGIPLSEAYKRCYPHGVKFASSIDPERKVPCPAYPPADIKSTSYSLCQAWQEVYSGIDFSRDTSVKTSHTTSTSNSASNNLLFLHGCSSGGQKRIAELFTEIDSKQPDQLKGKILIDYLVFLLSARSMISTSFIDVSNPRKMGTCYDTAFGFLLTVPFECLNRVCSHDCAEAMEGDQCFVQRNIMLSKLINENSELEKKFWTELGSFLNKQWKTWWKNPLTVSFLKSKEFDEETITKYLTYINDQQDEYPPDIVSIYKYLHLLYPQEYFVGVKKTHVLGIDDTPQQILDQTHIYNETVALPRTENPYQEISIVGLFYESHNITPDNSVLQNLGIEPTELVPLLKVLAEKIGVSLYDLNELRQHPHPLTFPIFKK